MTRELRVNWIRCDGYGLCGDLVPELIDLDEWRYPIISPGGVPGELLHAAQRAVDCCPMRALRLESVAAARNPEALARTGKRPEAIRSGANGPTVAALGGALLALLVLAMANIATQAPGGLGMSIDWPKGWNPGSVSGLPVREAVGLLVWVLSWGVLHAALRHRVIPFRPFVLAMAGIIGVTAMLFWSPVIDLIKGG